MEHDIIDNDPAPTMYIRRGRDNIISGSDGFTKLIDAFAVR
jgi:hypothetical protein